MKCFTSVLQMIGFLFIGMLLTALAGAVVGLAAYGTQHVFGWPDWAGFSCFVVYLIVTLGTFIGVMECNA